MPKLKLNYEQVVNLLQAVNITLALDKELSNQTHQTAALDKELCKHPYQTAYVLERRDEVLSEIKRELEEMQSDAG